ncbi:MAG: CoA synthetase [Candidatus Rokubacteria bacterium]|nr:CoA synthetase [Candidatus Rokubacteria bacterium]
MEPYSAEELMAAVIAREVRDGETVAVGTLAPVPASGVLLAHFTHAPRARVVILNHPDYWPFHGGSKEFYDFAQRGGLDLFFLGGGQIDRHGNLNLIAIGDAARPTVRLPGGAGSAMLYYVARRVIVFRTDHSPRVFVERVDHVTSPGSSPADVVRPGGPSKTVTPLCVFRFDRVRARLVVEALHPGVSRQALERSTGFPVEYESTVAVTPPPTAEELAVLRTRVRDAVARAYPIYAAATAP